MIIAPHPSRGIHAARRRSIRCTAREWFAVLMLCAAAPQAVIAQRLPVRAYTAADGLAGDETSVITSDAQGFLWIGTTNGLSRFDGRTFVNYGVRDGLPSVVIRDVCETSHNGLLVVTDVGVVRLHARHGVDEPLFTALPIQAGLQPLRDCRQILEDRAGTLWLTVGPNLYTMPAPANDRAQDAFTRMALDQQHMGEAPPALVTIRGLAEDSHGCLWILGSNALLRRLPDGRLRWYRVLPPGGSEDWNAILLDGRDRVWIGGPMGLVVFVPQSPECTDGESSEPLATIADRLTPTGDFESTFRPPTQPGEAHLYHAAHGLLNVPYPSKFVVLRDGTICFTTSPRGLTLFDGESIKVIGHREGMPDWFVMPMWEDGDGNLWLATIRQGIRSLARNGVTTWLPEDGLYSRDVITLLVDASGSLHAVGRDLQPHRFAPDDHDGQVTRIDGNQLTSVRPRLADGVRRINSRRGPLALRDHLGEWWITGDSGLMRYRNIRELSDLAAAPPSNLYAAEDGITGMAVTCLLEDARGDIWIGSDAEPRLMRWDRTSETFHAREIDRRAAGAPTTMEMGADGTLWIGLASGFLARKHDDGFEIFGRECGLPAAPINDIAIDGRGRVIVATRGAGLGWCDFKTTSPASFTFMTTADGLASDHINSVAAAADGHLYAGSVAGLEQIDPDTRRVRRFTTRDGLAGGLVFAVCVDDRGAVWAGCSGGLSRVIPQTLTALPPRVLISRVEVNGEALPLSETGERAIAHLEFAAAQNHVRVEYLGLSFAGGQDVRFQYRLGGSEAAWSQPTDQRSVDLAGLSSGSYRLDVRAINADGVASERPAFVEFSVAAPWWRRWWVLTLSAVLLAAGGWAAHRQRLGRMLAVQRVRARIAADLHDDLGSSLSRISILSEVARREIASRPSKAGELLQHIGDTAREMVDATGDMAWSIDPRLDNLASVAVRLRGFAAEVFEARGVRWTLNVPEESTSLRLAGEQRRHLYLIMKEALNNIARHAGATHARLAIERRDGSLEIAIADDGCGIPPHLLADGTAHPESDVGNGLRNMASRTRDLGGELHISDVEGGAGTIVRLRVPLA